MAVRIVCSACNTVMQVSEELRGKKIKCKSCGDVVSVPDNATAPAGEFSERKRMPSAPPPPAKRRVVDEDDRDDDERRSSRRRRRAEKSSGGMLPWLIAGGGVVGVGLIVLVVVLLLRSPTPPAQPVNPNGGQPVAQNQPPGVQPAVNVAPEKRTAPPLIPDPPAGETMKGERIYERLLQSTVWIVADLKIGGNNRPLAKFSDVQHFQFGPKLPKIKGPPIGPPGFPQPPGFFPGMVPQAGQKSNLKNTRWNGTETLPGFGKLNFQFITDSSVVMVDAKETLRGSYVHTGNNVTITFSGGIIYNGAINGNTMSGNATNAQDNWTWTVNKIGGGAPTPANPIPGIGDGMVVKTTGSGSLIDRKYRLIITNVHVIGTSNQVDIYFPEYNDKVELIVRSDSYKAKPGYKGRVVMKEERADLALVQLDTLPQGVQPLALAKKKAIPAQQVHSVGNPGASNGLWAYSPGKIRQVIPNDDWQITDELDGKTYNYRATKIETDSAINPGDSGGPLVDDRCAMVGVAHGLDLGANNFSFFIEASEVRQLLERYYRSVNDNFTP